MILSAPAQGALTGYLKIPDIAGESKRIDHEDEIDIHGLEFFVRSDNSATAGATRTRTPAEFGDLILSKYTDASSVYLYLAVAQGKAFDEIAGEVVARGYEDWIAIESFRTGLMRSLESEGSTRIRAAALPEAFVVSKRIDASSLYLLLASLQQRNLPTVILESTSTPSKEGGILLRHVLSNARVVEFRTETETASSGVEPLRETVKFDFEEWGFHLVRTDLEAISATWNFQTGTGGWSGDNAPARPLIDPLEVLVVSPGKTYEVPLTISDKDTLLEAIAVNADSMDPEKISILGLEGTGEKRILTFAVSKLFSGSAAIRLQASDEFQSSARTLMLSIEGGETPYETFLLAAFGAAVTENRALGLPIGDPDNDSLMTIAEFYLGTDPNVFTAPEDAVETRPAVSKGMRQIKLRFFRRVDTPGLTSRLYASGDFKDWVELGSGSIPPYRETAYPVGGAYEQVEAEIDLPPENWEEAFLRLLVEGTF